MQFESAYDMYGNSIFRYLFVKTSNRDRALDLTQETFLGLWKYLSQDKQITEMRPFLYKVAYNTFAKSLRKSGKEISLDSLLEEGWEAPSPDDVQSELIEKEEQQLVANRLSELTDTYREVLLLRYTEGLSIPEIAQILDQTENVVSVRIHRGIQQLKKLYGQR